MDKLSIAINALKDIIDPIGTLKRELKEGETLNGQIAVILANDVIFLRNLAKNALKQIEEIK